METRENKINIDKNMDEKQIKNLFCQLFKFDKSFFMSFIFYIHIVIQVFVFVSNLYIASKFGFLAFLWALILAPFVFFMVRFWFEFLVILFSINDNLFEIKNNLKK